MKRKLTNEEAKLEQAGLDRNEKELKLLKENYEYNSDLINNQIRAREHDDKWRDFLRRQKDMEDKHILDTIKKEIEIKEQMVKTAEEHLKNGVTIKMPMGVG